MQVDSLDELVSRVPPVRRTAFLSLARRAEVVAAVEPELRLPRAMASLVARPAMEIASGLVGRSPALQRITRQLEPIGKSNATVLVRGESGTGKEVLADALHTLSPRRHMPLVKVNCAAMVEELLLSELFGHEKGAFTGAIRERKGRFELADGGTIFPRRDWRHQPQGPRSRCCGCCRNASSSAWAARRRSRSTCASSARPTATSKQRFVMAASAPTSTTGSRA